MIYHIEHPCYHNDDAPISRVKATYQFVTIEGCWVRDTPGALKWHTVHGYKPINATLFRNGDWWGLRQSFNHDPPRYYLAVYDRPVDRCTHGEFTFVFTP